LSDFKSLPDGPREFIAASAPNSSIFALSSQKNLSSLGMRGACDGGEPGVIMNKAYKVVVGYDFTTQADTALAMAVQSLSGHEHPELHAVFASTEKGVQADLTLAANQKELANLLQTAVAKYNGDVTLYAHVRSEAPGKAILRLAAEIEANAIFVGTHNRKGLSRLVLGSVAEQVMRLANCSVIVAKERSYIADKDDDLLLMDPPSPCCLAKRQETNGEQWWCDTHAKAYRAPHRYSYTNEVARTRSPNHPAY
jgi:nucleotide-binding universal stress UspA family protein